MIAIIYFPGMNCENETKLACEAVGMKAEIVRWNTSKDMSSYSGYIFPGGWSYEDRIRAGVIASLDPLMDKIKKEAAKGKPVLGICNGCQIIVESGLIPGLSEGVEMAVAPNTNPLVSGYYSTWINVKNTGGKNAFNKHFSPEEVIPMPIAHGEGRFVTKNEQLVSELEKNGQIAFTYCTKEGEIDESFPTNPNGATKNIAGITNKEGNILAMMPHPERGMFKKQLKEKHMHSFDDAMAFTSAASVFKSMKESL